MDFQPLTVSTVNWSALGTVCKDTLGIDPRAIMDKCGLSQKKPATFLAALQLSERPDLEKSFLELQHFHASFISGVTQMELSKLQTLPNLTTLTLNGTEGQVVILTASLFDWQTSIRYGCAPDSHPILRKAMTQIFNLLSYAGFSVLWQRYHQTEAPNGDIILK